MNKAPSALKIRTARLSIISNIGLIILKTIAAFYSGSVSIISEAIHSSLDLVAAIIAFIAVRISDKPADKEHPFGHGKFENISGVIEALLIFLAAFWIIYEAFQKLIRHENILEQDFLMVGIVVMLLSGLVNFFVSRRLYQVAKETGSMALEADALHLKTDIYTSIGVGLGLLAIHLTGYYFLDPIIAIIVALYIIYEASKLLVKAFNPLIDSSLSEVDVVLIKRIIEHNIPKDFSFSDLRTRQSGPVYIIQFHLITSPSCAIADWLKIRNHLEEVLRNEFPKLELIILVDTLDSAALT
jgi:cation diffusion facilitator family transporter